MTRNKKQIIKCFQGEVSNDGNTYLNCSYLQTFPLISLGSFFVKLKFTTGLYTRV